MEVEQNQRKVRKGTGKKLAEIKKRIVLKKITTTQNMDMIIGNSEQKKLKKYIGTKQEMIKMGIWNVRRRRRCKKCEKILKHFEKILNTQYKKLG